MDGISQARRSWNMSRIRSKDTTPERIVRSFLHRHGFRFRLHVKDLPGTPDIVLPKYKTVIEVRGCYWHRHEGCKCSYTPKNNAEFWQKKFAENIARDQRTEAELRGLGWRVIVIWDCEIAQKKFSPKSLTDFVNKCKAQSQ